MEFEKESSVDAAAIHEIPIKVEYHIFRAMLEFIYSGRTHVSCREDAIRLSELASAYSIDTLVSVRSLLILFH